MSEPTNSNGRPNSRISVGSSASLWDFSVALYERETVRTICLTLQDAFAADVNLILYCLWLGATGRGQIDSDVFAHLSEAVSVWHKEVVVPIRSARIRLRTPPKSVSPSAARSLRGRIKEIELEAERIELDVLAESLDRSPVAHDADRRERDMTSNLTAYLGFIGAPASDNTASAVAALVAECRPD